MRNKVKTEQVQDASAYSKARWLYEQGSFLQAASMQEYAARCSAQTRGMSKP